MLDRFKMSLARVFDDNLHTKKWHNIVDYLIIAIIIISSLEIFLSTFDIDPKFRRVLRWIDIITLVFFTIEVTLRIWVAPLVNPKYKGWKGRLKYCFTFHGFIDIISTYPFYFQWLFPLPIAGLKVLRMSRVVRLFRISRYMKSWKLLTNAIREKRRELIVSMQFLLIATFILSLILYFCEHDVQPHVYSDGSKSVLWAFAQYIGDPGGFGDTPPVTVFGRVIACIVGLLGIAIVAVPAGIIGSGFTEALEKENDKERISKHQAKMRLCFERKLDKPTNYQIVPPYRTLCDIQARQSMTEADIIEAVNATPGYRLINLAATKAIGTNPVNVLAVEHFEFNRSYGYMIDRGSPLTIISPSSYVDPAIGIFAYYLAKIGGFNYISREFGDYAPAISYYIVKKATDVPEFKEYLEDLKSLTSRPDSWTFVCLAASGANEPEYPEQIHFGSGAAKGSDTLGDLITDKEKFKTFLDEFTKEAKDNLGIDVECDQYYTTASPAIIFRKYDLCRNNIIMRVAWSAMLWDPNRFLLAKSIAADLNKYILGNQDLPVDPQLKIKNIGYEGYIQSPQ